MPETTYKMWSRCELEYQDIKPRKKSNYLTWSEWSNASLLNYLNIIDFSRKRATTDVVPWVDIPAYEEDVLRFCKSTIYNSYKPRIMNKITSEDNSNISNALVKFIRVCNIYDVFRDEDERSQLYYDILNCLFDKGCKDPTLMLLLWNEICGGSERSRTAVFECLIGKHRRKRAAKLLLYVLKIAREIRFDFWGAWVKGHALRTFHYCPVTAALLNGNVEQMTVLLQYGFYQNCQRVHTYDKFFQVCINSAYSWLRKPLVETTSKRRKVLTEILLFLKQMSTCTSSRRCSALQECFQLLWDTVPEPHVTTQELLVEVENRFHNVPEPSLPCKRTQLLKLCLLYEKLNPMETVVQPRTLKHLCKCNIRDILQGTMNLPCGINYLPLPRGLQLYLSVT